MRAAAQLDGERAHADHTDHVAVFFAKQGSCPKRFCIIKEHFGHRDRHTCENVIVYDLLDPCQLCLCQGSKMGKVEAAFFAVNKRARLLYVIAKHLAKCCLQEMRHRVVACNS